MKIEGKTFLITGASSGIGKALVYKSAERNANLCIGARRFDRLLQIKEEIEQKYKVKVVPVKLDVRNKESIKYFVGTALENFDSIDVLINNAGVGLEGSIEKVEEEYYDYVMDTNVKGVYLLTKEVVPVMKNQYGGTIVNISSLGGYVGMPLYSIYSTSKFAVRGLTESLRMELRPYKIRVIGVYPGPIPTEFQKMTKRLDEHKEKKQLNFFWDNIENSVCKIIKGIERGKRDIFIRPLWWFTAALVSRYPSLFDLIYNKFYR